MDNYKPLSQLASTHPAFRELAKYVWDEHVKRRPEIDAKMKPLRLKSWEISDANLPEGHPRKGVKPPHLLDGAGLI